MAPVPDASRTGASAALGLGQQPLDLGPELGHQAVVLGPGGGAVEAGVDPAAVRDPMLAKDGRARIQVFPRYDLSDAANLTEFIDGVTRVAPESTGPAVGLVEWGRVTSGAMQQAMAVGFAATLLFLLVLWRSLWDTLLAFFPMLLAGLLTCAVMVLAGWSFDFANVIVLPMLLGMGTVLSGVAWAIDHLARRVGHTTGDRRLAARLTVFALPEGGFVPSRKSEPARCEDH